MRLDTRVFPDMDALSRGALEEVSNNLRDALAQRGRFVIALSGGHTPAKMYSLWGAPGKYRDETPWDRVHMFWGDERYVPTDDPLSNYRMTRETLLSHVPIPAAECYPAPTSLPTPEKAAEAYDAQLRGFFGSEEPHGLAFSGIAGSGRKAALGHRSTGRGETTRSADVHAAGSEPQSKHVFLGSWKGQARNRCQPSFRARFAAKPIPGWQSPPCRWACALVPRPGCRKLTSSPFL